MTLIIRRIYIFSTLLGTEKTAFEIKHGCTWVDYQKKDCGYAKVFFNAMIGVTGLEAQAVTRTLVEKNILNSEIKVVCDVGGGQGSLISSVVKGAPNPDIKGIDVDIPLVIENIIKSPQNKNPNISYAIGNMFETVPNADI